MVDENMSSAARVHAIESGHSLPKRTLVAFGGGAPLHAARMAEKLDIARVVIPAAAGVGSAVGFLRAPVSFEVVRTHYQRLGEFDHEAINRALDEMAADAAAIVRGATNAPTQATRRAYMRYVGQGHEILVDVGTDRFGADAGAALRARFDREYERVYGRSLGGLADVEVASWVVTVATAPTADPAKRGADAPRRPDPMGVRRVFDPGARQAIEHALYRRAELAPGDALDGPAVIVEDETSTVVSPRFRARINAYGDIELHRKEAAA